MQNKTPLEASLARFGNLMVQGFHTIALFCIGLAVFWSGAHAYLDMMKKGFFTIDDILLLFIYLELGAMVGIYFKTSKLPVRFLIYVSITAITRVMIGMLNVSHKADMGILIGAGAIFVLTLATLALRYGSWRMPLDAGVAELSDPVRIGSAKGGKKRTDSDHTGSAS